MKRWYQRQWWYIEKPMPWAMIVLWPFLWVVGTVDEFIRWFRKGEHPAAPTVRMWDKDLNYIGTLDNEPWLIITEEKPGGYFVSAETPTMEWKEPYEMWLPFWTGVIPPIVDRDYE